MKASAFVIGGTHRSRSDSRSPPPGAWHRAAPNLPPPGGGINARRSALVQGGERE